MHCARCGFSNPQGSRFCRQCGARLTGSGRRPRTKVSGAARPARRRIRWGRLVLMGTTVLVVGIVAFVASKVAKAVATLPTVPALLSTGPQDSVIYDIYGQPIMVLHGNENRIALPLSQIAPVMQTAIIDTEDHNFYSNPGFDLKSIARAALADLRHGAGVQGASTITEQLAKNLFLTDNHSLTYKIQEFLLGLKLARTYTKHQILDMYLNTVYFGDGAFGVGTAANAYFDEPASRLTLAQAALLAGLPQAPSLYDPFVNYKLAKARQLEVLDEMVKYGSITPAEAQAAYQAPLNLHPGPLAATSTTYPYPWFVTTVLNQLERTYHLSEQTIYGGGLKIYTTLNPTVYNIAQNAVTYWMNRNFGSPRSAYPFHQAAVVVMNPHNGYVYAIIGGREPSQAYEGGINYAFQHRSTGSSIKPVLDYTPALAKGYTAMTVIQDLPVPQYRHGSAWWPQNDDHYYRGYIDLRDALAISDNNVAVKLLGKIGLQYAVNFANQKFGLDLSQADIAQQGLGMAIGGFNHGPTPMQMAEAYDTIANGGSRVTPIFITKVVNSYGAVLVQNTPDPVAEFSPQVAYIMTTMMERVFYPGPLPGLSRDTGIGEYTTGYGLYPGFPAAGKTGTNNNFADAWFDGFSPYLEVVVWEGRQDEEANVPQLMTGPDPYGGYDAPAYGATAAGPIWDQIMEQASTALHLPGSNFPVPPGIITENVSITSGDIPGPNTPPWDIQSAPFIAGTQPTQVGTNHIQVQVLASNPNLLWEPGCGPAITRVFLKPESDYLPSLGMPKPLDAIEWPPTQTCTPAGGAGAGPSSTSPSSASGSPSSSTSPSSPSAGPTSPAPPSVPLPSPSTPTAGAARLR